MYYTFIPEPVRLVSIAFAAVATTGVEGGALSAPQGW